jgi:hypothetical protein
LQVEQLDEQVAEVAAVKQTVNKVEQWTSGVA